MDGILPDLRATADVARAEFQMLDAQLDRIEQKLDLLSERIEKGA